MVSLLLNLHIVRFPDELDELIDEYWPPIGFLVLGQVTIGWILEL